MRVGVLHKSTAEKGLELLKLYVETVISSVVWITLHLLWGRGQYNSNTALHLTVQYLTVPTGAT